MLQPDSSTRISDTAGTIWAYVQNWAARGITLVVFFVLARLLTPAEFGAFAVAMVFVTLGEVFVEQLFGHVIVQRGNLTDAHLSSAFWATLLIGAALALTTLIAAPFFAVQFDSPGVEPVIMALTPVFLFMALASIPAALLRRALDYRTLARRTAMSNLLSGVVAIAAAASDLGVWTFVLQQLVFHAVSTWILWRHASWRPHKVFDRKALGELFSFSSRITLVKLLDLVETRVLELVIARYLGIVALGNYALATRAQQAAIQLLAAPLWESSISIFARIQTDRAALAAAFKYRAQLVALLIMPTFLFAAASAEALVPAVFGGQWRQAVTTFQLLCVLGAMRSLTFLYGAMLQAVGEAGASLTISFVRTLITICALPVLLRYGPAGVAGCMLLGQVAVLPFIFRIVFLKLGLSSMGVFRSVAKPVMAGCIAAAVSLVLVRWMEGLAPDFLRAVTGLGVSALGFVALIVVLMPGTLMRHTARLPVKLHSRVRAVLDAVIRFEDDVRTTAYLMLMKSSVGTRQAARGSRDMVLIFADSYSIVGSVGDQALFGGLMALLRQTGNTRARVLCRPGVTLPLVEGVSLEPLPLWGSLASARELARELVGARALIVVGADTLDGFYSRFESLLRLGIAAHTARRGIPAVLCSFSFNDRPDPTTVEAFKKLPPGVALLCRDSVSRDRLAKFLGSRVQLTADLAYLLEPAKHGELELSVSEWLAGRHRRTGPVLGWNLSPHSLKLLSPAQRDRAAESTASVIARLVAERDATVVLIPHDFRPHASDPAMLADIFSRIPVAARNRVMLAVGPYSAADVKQVVSHFDLVITGRMHLMIAALGQGVPILAVEYQGKFAGALAHFCLSQNHVLEPADVCSPELLFQRVSSRLNELSLTRNEIQVRRSVVQAMASKFMTEFLRRQS